MTTATTRTTSTASATGSRRRRYVSGAGSDPGISRVRDTWQESADQVAEVGQVAREQRLVELRRALNAPAWAAAVAAMGQEGGKP
jgi:hypothetical protein